MEHISFSHFSKLSSLRSRRSLQTQETNLLNKAHVIGHCVAINNEKQYFLVMTGVSEIFRYSKAMMKNNDF